MKKKLAIIGGIVPATLAIPSGIVLAQQGIEGFEAFIQALEYGLRGLEEYFEFIADLFKIAVE